MADFGDFQPHSQIPTTSGNPCKAAIAPTLWLSAFDITR
jgi:hypothetical protein